MKKLLFFMALIVSFAFISCSDDDGPSGGNDLAGTWTIVEVLTVDHQGLDDCVAQSWVRFDDSTVTSKTYERENGVCLSEQLTLKYTKDGSVLTIVFPDGTEGIVRYSISGDRLTLRSDDGVVVYKRN